MASTAFVRARIDETLKNEATAVLEEFGLTVSDVVRMTLTRIAKDGAVPLELKVPNGETRTAMAEFATSHEKAQRTLQKRERHLPCPRRRNPQTLSGLLFHAPPVIRKPSRRIGSGSHGAGATTCVNSRKQ